MDRDTFLFILSIIGCVVASLVGITFAYTGTFDFLTIARVLGGIVGVFTAIVAFIGICVLLEMG